MPKSIPHPNMKGDKADTKTMHAVTSDLIEPICIVPYISAQRELRSELAIPTVMPARLR